MRLNAIKPAAAPTSKSGTSTIRSIPPDAGLPDGGTAGPTAPGPTSAGDGVALPPTTPVLAVGRLPPDGVADVTGADVAVAVGTAVGVALGTAVGVGVTPGPVDEGGELGGGEAGGRVGGGELLGLGGLDAAGPLQVTRTSIPKVATVARIVR